ncbi:RING/U-box superfamily protein [Actinidia rufa]|uniref:RING/U-box superfamily protein n=1 Tax=Actinidia rufa TaxID=165716 RepID=A0A7J0F9R3_9ERIC|nr:RING/U-box superfamily protein [Actinidia rufa]
MEEQEIFGCGSSLNSCKEVKLEDDEEEFRSCCDEDDLKEREDSSVKEGSDNKKKLDFFVDESVADYLALMDGLLEAVLNKITRMFAFTDSEILYNQIINEEKLENPLLALRQRILEHAEDLDAFVLKLVPHIDLERPLLLAQAAIGIVSFPAKGDESFEKCSICCEEKPVQMMITMKCFHEFCSHCMKTYVDGKVESAQVPIRCPQLKCKYFISTTESRSFLPVASYEMLERAPAEANILDSEKNYCPFPNCSILLDPRECLSNWVSLRKAKVIGELLPYAWCGQEGYRVKNIKVFLKCVVQMAMAWPPNCEVVSSSLESNHFVYIMSKDRCGHEFCYSCGTGYKDSQQTCQCAFWDEENSEDSVTYPTQESEQWAWDSFDSLPMIMDAYSDQERSQLALI